MSTTIERRFLPTDLGPDEQARLERALGELASGDAVVLTRSGEEIDLPSVLQDLFVVALQAVRRKETIFLVEENEELSTQAAADFLGLSRQYLVRLLEDGKIPFHRAGTHRRVLVKNLVLFQEQKAQSRRAKLNAMTDELIEAGLYDRFVPLERDAAEN